MYINQLGYMIIFITTYPLMIPPDNAHLYTFTIRCQDKFCTDYIQQIKQF